MGIGYSHERRPVPTEDPEVGVQDQERKSNKFSGYFYLGKGYFRSIDPDSYLFGDKSDVEFLPQVPSLFPYQRPLPKDPTGVLKCLVNVQKDSIKLLRIQGTDEYHLEFTYDADVDFDVKILEKVPRGTSLEELLSMSELETHKLMCNAGSGMVYKDESHILTLRDEDEDTLSVTDDSECYPLAILVNTVAGSGQRYLKQHHLTVVSIEKSNVESAGYLPKVIKQKLLSDHLEFVLQDVYGLENKGNCGEGQDEGGFDDIDSGAECVICFTDVRDTVLLPCRHLCVCGACAASLRYKASNCPICRAPFRALLRVQAVVKAPEDENIDEEGMEFPEYRVIPLMTALNGYPKYDPNANTDENDEGSSDSDAEEGEEAGQGDRQQEGGEEENVGEEVEQEEELAEETLSTPVETPVEVVIENTHLESNGPEECQATVQANSTHKRSDNSPSSQEDDQEVPLPGTPVEEHEVLVVECTNRSSLSTSEEGMFKNRSDSVGSSKTSDTSACSTSKLI